jgi:ADP-ribosylglycohydrolase
MWGAIIGDLAGSIYEFDQVNETKPVKVKEIIEADSFFSDDTILTIAILDAFLNDRDYEKYLKKYALEYLDYKPNHEPYFKRPFSPGFIKWAKGEKEGTSNGNGAMMRISSIGYLSNSEEELIDNVLKATTPSHNTNEAIEGATTVAKIIYLARKGLTKEQIIQKLRIKLQYEQFTSFNMTCDTTINNCLYALFTSNSFEDAIKTVISYGGDTDTNACIVGSMAEALYGIEPHLVEQATEKLPSSFVKKLNQGYSSINNS